MTRADGTFRVLGLAEGTYTIHVDLGFVKMKDPSAALASGKWSGIRAGAHDLRLVLSRAQSITGRVLGADGGPAQDAWVNAIDPEDAAGFMPVASTRSDNEGRFKLDVPAGMRVDLQANLEAKVAGTDVGEEWLATTTGVAAGATDVVLKLVKQ